jgi:hypothetical protein
MRAVKTVDFQDAMNRVASHDHGDQASKEKRVSTTDLLDLSGFAPVPRSARGPAVNEQGYYVNRVERNLYWVTDGPYQLAFLTTSGGIRRAVDEIASANGVSNKLNYRHVDTGGTA